MLKQSLLASLVIAASPVCVTAQTIEDRVGLAREALSAGNERVAIYAASDPRLPAQIRMEAGRLSFARGYTPNPQGSGVIAKSAFWSPVLSYDPDINGGSAKDGFRFGGFDFLIPEESRKKSGIVAGASMNAFLRYSAGRQTVVDLSVGAYAAYSPKHDISKMTVNGSACVTRQLERDLYLSGCASVGASRNDLSSDMNATVRGSVNKIVDIGSHAHDLKFSISENGSMNLEDSASYRQTRLEFSGQAVSPEGHVFGYAAMIGEKVEDRKVRTLSLSGQYGFDSPKGQAFIGAGYASFDGATWLGRPVDEDEYSVFLQIPLHQKVDGRIELTRTISGSEIEDGDEVSFYMDVKF